MNDRKAISGLFAWYHSNEPSAQFYGTPGDPGAVFRPGIVNAVALNYVATPGDRSVRALRYGYLRLRDDSISAPTDPRGLGFVPEFERVITGYPRINVFGYGFGALGMAERASRVHRLRIRRARRCPR